MADELERLETWIGELMARVEPGMRRKLARDIGLEARKANAERIAAQVNPDRSPFVPRKPREPLRAKAGRIRRRAKQRAMFAKLRSARYLQVKASDSQVEVGFTGADARIATVHHYGLRDRVNRRRSSPEVTYPARQLLGLPDEDRGRIMERILAQLGV